VYRLWLVILLGESKTNKELKRRFCSVQINFISKFRRTSLASNHIDIYQPILIRGQESAPDILVDANHPILNDVLSFR